MTAVMNETINRTGSTSDEWQDFHSAVVIPELGERVVAGDISDKAGYVAFFQEVDGGLDDSHEGEALPPWLAPFIDALIAVLIELIRSLF